ncbi:MAG: nucleotide sugar dehydrogenase [Candidatus Jordarchaeales archaeon]
MRSAVIGAGVVGRATGIGLQMYGYEVIFYDVNPEKTAELEKQGFKVARSVKEAVRWSDISFVCVQTPYVDSRVDLSYLKSAIMSIGESLDGENYHVVAVRSTVPPFTTRNIVVPLLQECSGLRVGKDFGVCFNPEFLREASALQDFLNPARVVIGEVDKRAGDVLEEVYKPFKAPIIRTNPETAEVIKYVANTFLATKISFFNEVYLLCAKLGLDPNLVAETVALDPRIGKYGIYGGRPFGGSCLPKDLKTFIQFFRENGVEPTLLSAVLAVNEKMEEIQKRREMSERDKCLQ